ncbi:unnamed protein product [Orchesella dallaii]|uniref:Outer dense fiber protein 3 n=1 Tax=Orchesella dallaii TaxID=48710 RepID=A0ABP1PPV6_9HEXA
MDASVGGRFTNCQNMTRFGPANPPKPLILSRRYPRDRSEPGPGKYDPKDLNDTRLGITVKSRIPPIGQQESPGFLELPDTMGDGPAFSFGLKNFMVMTDQSPGPIYQINKARPKPVSLTFRPFPMRGHESDPSPIEWGTKPAEDKIKNLPRAPCAIIHGNHDTLKGKFKTPGPNKYFIEDCPCVEPGASFKGRYKQKIEVTPGPANYTPKYAYEVPPRAVIQGRHKEKVKKLHDPGFITMKPDRIVGGLMTPRWRDREEEVVVPEMTNIFGLTNRGHKSGIPITFKSRHTPFKYSHMAEPPSAEHGGSDGQC